MLSFEVNQFSYRGVINAYTVFSKYLVLSISLHDDDKKVQ